MTFIACFSMSLAIMVVMWGFILSVPYIIAGGVVPLVMILVFGSLGYATIFR